MIAHANPRQSILHKLPAASICGFSLVPRVRANLLATSKAVSLMDLVYYLFDDDNNNAALANVARTSYERQATIDGLLAFLRALSDASKRGRASSTKIAWIVPQYSLTHGTRLKPIVARRIERHPEISSHLGDDYQLWLPWMSLGIVNLLRRWRSPRISSIRRAVFKFVNDLSGNTVAEAPWEHTFPDSARRVPLQALFQYEPTNLVDGAINALTDLGFKSVGDLRICHPDAVAAAKHPRKPLFSVHKTLHQEQDIADPTTATVVSTSPRLGNHELVLLGKKFPYRNATEAVTIVLGELARTDTSFLGRCFQHPRNRGRKRRHIARSLAELYPGRPDLEVYHQRLPGGWLLGTNISNVQKTNVILLAADCAGLKIGSDIDVPDFGLGSPQRIG